MVHTESVEDKRNGRVYRMCQMLHEVFVNGNMNFEFSIKIDR